MKRILFFLLILSALAACSRKPDSGGAPDAWAREGVVYELNVRQLTPEGSFAAAETQLPLLKELGVDIIWVMPP